jgi:hypothetical protein
MSTESKPVLDRITINNILAFMIVGSYSGMWLFLMWYGITQSADPSEMSLLILQLVGDLKEIIITMTIITVLVVQYHFRTSPSK